MNVDDVNKRRQISAILRKLESKFSAIYHNIKDKSEFKILYDSLKLKPPSTEVTLTNYKPKVAPPPHQNYEL